MVDWGFVTVDGWFDDHDDGDDVADGFYDDGDWWLVIDDSLMTHDWLLTLDGLWVMLLGWWLMIDAWWLVIGHRLLMINALWFVDDDDDDLDIWFMMILLTDYWLLTTVTVDGC